MKPDRLEMELTTFEGVDFEADVTRLVEEQLATGSHRGGQDSAPGDWLVRAWQALPANGRQQLSTAVNQALQHENPNIRAEAVRTLDMCPQMADPATLLSLAENRLDLFRGLRGPGDDPQVDRGREFVQLTAGRANGDQARHFRRRLAHDPDYGMQVLAALAQKDTAWMISHAGELFDTDLDPDGVRLNIVFFNLRQQPDQLAQLVTNLGQRRPELHGRLRHTIETKVRDAQLQQRLLDLVED